MEFTLSDKEHVHFYNKQPGESKEYSGNVQFSIYAATGYIFSSAPTVEINGRTYTFVLNTNKDRATWDGFVTLGSGSAEIQTTLESTAKHVTINVNAENCILTPTEVELGVRTTFTVTANDGYTIKGTPYIINQDGTRSNFTVASDKRTATLTKNFMAGTETLDFYGNTEAEAGKTVNIVNNVLNASATPESATLGQITEITVSANEGFSFEVAPTVSTNETQQIETTLSQDKKTATLSYTFPNTTTTIEINGEVVGDVKTLAITEGKAENCSYQPHEITLGVSSTITVTANDGYIFEKQPYLLTYDGSRLVFTLSADSTKATYTRNFDTSYTELTLYAEAVEKKELDYNPFVAIFVPTLNQLKTLGNIAQINPDTGNDLNLAQYIYGLYKTFVDVPVETEEKNILLGKYDTKISANICNKEIIPMAFNIKTDTSWEQDIYSYPPYSEYKLFVPFVGMVDIDPSLIYRASNIVVYECNLLSMKCTVTYLNGTTYPVYTWEGEIGYNYPFVQGKQFSRLDFNYTNNFLYDRINNIDMFTPYLYRYRKNPYDNGREKLGRNITYYVETIETLKGSGRIEISNLKFPDNSQITETEKEEVRRLLEEGVYI